MPMAELGVFGTILGSHGAQKCMCRDTRAKMCQIPAKEAIIKCGLLDTESIRFSVIDHRGHQYISAREAGAFGTILGFCGAQECMCRDTSSNIYQIQQWQPS